MDDATRRTHFETWFAGPPMSGDREVLIRKSGYTKGRISQLFDPAQPFGERAARSLALRLGLPSDVFDTPPGSKQQLNVEEVPQLPAVPLISWVQAGAWSDVSDPHAPGVADDWLPCPVRHGPNTYALRVRGESMFNPDGKPSYSDGDIIFVDPSREAHHGDRVVVRLDDQAEVTFKQLLVEDGRKMLKALNPDWKPRYIEINGNATMAGVVIGKWVPE
jgi:SOS-response transcriptional repressor LexA